MIRYFGMLNAFYYTHIFAPVLEPVVYSKRLGSISTEHLWQAYLAIISFRSDPERELRRFQYLEREIKRGREPLYQGFDAVEVQRLLQFYAQLKLAPLKVTQIQFASPGFTDLTGIGAIVREIKELIVFAVKWPSEKKALALDLKRKKEELISVRLENAEKILALAKKAKLEPAQYAELQSLHEGHENSLADLTHDKRITGAEIVDKP